MTAELRLARKTCGGFLGEGGNHRELAIAVRQFCITVIEYRFAVLVSLSGGGG